MNWSRVGGVPGSLTGLNGFPLPAKEIFYLAYSTARGSETVTHRYDLLADQFTVVDESRVQITSATNLFEMKLNGSTVLKVDDGVFQTGSFTTKSPPLAEKIHFYRKDKTFAVRLATLTSDGTFYVPNLKIWRTPFRNLNFYLSSNPYRSARGHRRALYRNQSAYSSHQDYRAPCGFRFFSNEGIAAVIWVNGLLAVDVGGLS